MNLSKTIITLSLVFLSTLAAFGQDYNSGIGLRGGVSQGITFKTFTSKKAAFEGILHTRWQGIMVTGLYEIHEKFPNAKGLSWFYGFGGHLGIWEDRNGNRPWGNNNDNYTVLGADLIIGLDYLIPNSPVNLTLDYKPAFNFVGYSGVWADGVALSLRFTW